MLEASDLACVRGDQILFQGLSFAARPGEVLWIEGENGSGKTSLLRILCGLGSPDRGELHWGGRPYRKAADDLARVIAYVGHLNAVKDDLTVTENLRFHARLAGLPAGEQEVRDAIDGVGLTRRADLPVRVLSQGQRRRAALARLWLSRSRALWILDEPFSALDTASVTHLGKLLDGHVSGGGIAVLTTHQEVALPHGRTRRLRLDSRA